MCIAAAHLRIRLLLRACLRFNRFDIVCCGIRCRKERIAFVYLNAADKFSLLAELFLGRSRCSLCILKSAEEIADLLMRNRDNCGKLLALCIGNGNSAGRICHIGLDQLFQRIFGRLSDGTVCNKNRDHAGCELCADECADRLHFGFRAHCFTVGKADAGGTADDAVAVRSNQRDGCLRDRCELRKCVFHFQCKRFCGADKLHDFHISPNLP